MIVCNAVMKKHQTSFSITIQTQFLRFNKPTLSMENTLHGVATFFTFLPSFLFILAGGPLVEATRGEAKFTAPLTGITAAVVGVILSLAVFFAWHTFWPAATQTAPFSGNFEWFPVLVAIAAFVALWKYKADIMKVIGTCALLGLVHTLII